MIKLSKPSKMPCYSWSLQAITTCPASIGDDGELVDACKGCYATTGFYNMGSVVALREHNKKDWKRPYWKHEMIEAIKDMEYFRWFDSGDMYHPQLANKIYLVMRDTPNTKHWLPTRMHKFEKFRGFLDEMERLPNVVVRRSGDGIRGERINGANISTVIPTVTHPVKQDTFVCNAYERGGKCGDCRACWDKEQTVIAYPAHGKKMIKLLEVA